ncbi:MAG: AraC family transcriptional regulator [Proteobacteria bacterium]|nr:AraC family transcriptional regulator [Pseudomonadota bacterium]
MKDLVRAIERYIRREGGENPWLTAIPELILLRSDHPKPPAQHLLRPSLCIVAQGAKWASVGGQQYEYRAGQALVVSVEIPSTGRVMTARPGEPFVGAILAFDLAIMRAVADELDIAARPKAETPRGVFVSDFDGPLSDCVLRLVRLLDTPSAVPALAPLIMREICYWLLSGPHGAEVAQVTLDSRHASRVVGAVRLLRERFAEPVSVAELAAAAKLSPSAFHRQFKALTAMTPLQYQKQMRLLEARRLMVVEASNVESAAFAVGYESPSQFSREYSRMFGTPPKRDTRAIKILPPAV